MPPPPGPPNIPNSALVEMKRGQAVMIWAVGAYCVFGWEYIICLPQEYKRIWKKKLTFVSLLYIFNRYFGILQLSFVMSLLAGVWNAAACKHVFYWEPVGALISTVLSQMILGARVFALFAQSKAIAAVLSIILLAQIVVGGIAVSTTSPPPPVPGPPSAQPPCGAAMGGSGLLISFWAIPLFYDSVAFFLTAWKAYGYWKKDISTPLISVIWRDGVVYFFVIFSMNFANVVIFLAAPGPLRAVNLTPTLALEVVLSCRLLLNIRNTHAKTTGSKSGSNPNSQQSNTAVPSVPSEAAKFDKIRTAPPQPQPQPQPRPRPPPPVPEIVERPVKPDIVKPPFTPGKSEWIDLSSPATRVKLEPNRFQPPIALTEKPQVGDYPRRFT